MANGELELDRNCCSGWPETTDLSFRTKDFDLDPSGAYSIRWTPPGSRHGFPAYLDLAINHAAAFSAIVAQSRKALEAKAA